MNGVPFDGEEATPRAAWIVASLPSSPGGRPLLDYDTVLALAHELGHLLHFASSRRGLFGMSPRRLAWDMAREVVQLCARHSETGDTMPIDLVERLLASRSAFIGHEWMEILAKAEIDLLIHAGERNDSDRADLAHGLLTSRLKGRLPDRANWLASAGHPNLFSQPIGYAGGFHCPPALEPRTRTLALS